jgi:hypothetical protein
VYLDDFKARLVGSWSGSLFSLSSVREIHPRAKEYLHRLVESGGVKRVAWGWYWIPESYRDAWEFLARDRGFKVVVKQTAASLWNYGFVHRDVFRLAVNDRSYKRALETFAESMGWSFEVEFHREIPYEYRSVGGLLVENLEPCIVDCLAEWSFVDAFATLYLRRNEVDFGRLRTLGRWKRVSKTDLRAWTLVKYGCKLFNERLGREVFRARSFEFKAEIEQAEVKELVNEAVDKVVELA